MVYQGLFFFVFFEGGRGSCKSGVLEGLGYEEWKVGHISELHKGLCGFT